MKPTMQIAISSASFLLFAACVSTGPDPISAPVPPRDIAAAAKALSGSTVLDVDLFQPVVTIGKNCAGPATPDMGRPMPVSPKLQAAMEEAQAYSEAQKGVGLMIVRNGNIIHESYTGESTAATKTDSYSMHKSVLALTMVKALEDGIIASLDDPASQYIAEWKSDPRGKITLRQLLNMESGLKVYTFQDPDSKTLPLLLQSDINAVALSYPATEGPSQTFKYNNANSQLAGLALSRALKAKGYASYASYLEEKIWCPIGNIEADLWLDREGGSEHFFTGMFTTLGNWARLGELIRKDGKARGKQVIGEQWIDEMGKPASTNAAYGLQIWRGAEWQEKRRYNPENPLTVTHSAPYLADDVLFFDGFGGQRVYIIPSAGLTIARTGQVNFEYDDSKIVNIILSAME